MPCGWEGNRRFGVALAIRHRLKWSIPVVLLSHRLTDRQTDGQTTTCNNVHLLEGEPHDKNCVYKRLEIRIYN